MPEVSPEDKVLTPAEAAAVLDLKPGGLRVLEAAGRLTVMRTPGRHRRYYEDSVRALRGQIDHPEDAPPRDLTSAEVGHALGVTAETVVKWKHAGKIKGEWTKGHRLRVPAAEVARLLGEGGES